MCFVSCVCMDEPLYVITCVNWIFGYYLMCELDLWLIFYLMCELNIWLIFYKTILYIKIAE